MTKSLILLGSDHRGFSLKSRLAAWLKEEGWLVRDVGPFDDARCDAFDYAVKVAEEMRKDSTAKGVLICGTGQTMAMTTNRFGHCMAAVCVTPEMATLARQHNNANVLALGADCINEQTAIECLKVFLTTDFFAKDRYLDRVRKLLDLGGL